MMGDTWAPREGAYGRTRDGRRVTHDGWFIEIEGDGRLWESDGRFMNQMHYDPTRDLVAEWTEGPVRTVTRREIVPKTYGSVAVGDVTTNGDAVAISVGSGHYTADELDATARVLTELAGALRDRG